MLFDKHFRHPLEPCPLCSSSTAPHFEYDATKVRIVCALSKGGCGCSTRFFTQEDVDADLNHWDGSIKDQAWQFWNHNRFVHLGWRHDYVEPDDDSTALIVLLGRSPQAKILPELYRYDSVSEQWTGEISKKILSKEIGDHEVTRFIYLDSEDILDWVNEPNLRLLETAYSEQ